MAGAKQSKRNNPFLVGETYHQSWVLGSAYWTRLLLRLRFLDCYYFLVQQTLSSGLVMLWLSPVEYKSDKTTCKVSSVSGPATLQDARLNNYFTSWVCICIRKIELIEQLQSSISGPAARCKTEQLFKQIDTEEYTCNTYTTSHRNMIVHF